MYAYIDIRCLVCVIGTDYNTVCYTLYNCTQILTGINVYIIIVCYVSRVPTVPNTNYKYFMQLGGIFIKRYRHMR